MQEKLSPFGPLRGLAGALALVGGLAPAASASDITLRLSVKYVLDAQGQPTSKAFGNPAEVAAAVADMNAALRRFGRGYGYEVVEFAEVAGHPELFDVSASEYDPMVLTAKADPAFHWNPDAINVYIVDTADAAVGGELVLLMGDLIYTNWLHELAHHNGLAHTFDPDDHVADTKPQPDVLACVEDDTCNVGGSVECCCDTKELMLQEAALAGNWTEQEYEDIRFNSLAYFGALSCDPPLTYDNVRLTPGQMDRFTDWSRFYLAHEASGLTVFVDDLGGSGGIGSSSSPKETFAAGVAEADPSGGDIVLLRPGSYAGGATISKPLVLRASHGAAVIGG